MSMYQDRRWRSPYGIKEPGSPPRPTPFVIRLAELVSTKVNALRQRYESTNTSGQIADVTGDPYDVKLQAQWHRPTQPNAGPITQPIQRPPAEQRAYPGEPGSRHAPTSRIYGMDERSEVLGHARPAFLPGSYLRAGVAEPYERFASTNAPKAHWYRQDFLPVRIDDRTPPVRLVRPHRAGLSLMGGQNQFGTRQTWGQGGGSIVIAPPAFTRTVTQGVRSVGGAAAKNRCRVGTGRERIPAVFTPTSVQ